MFISCLRQASKESNISKIRAILGFYNLDENDYFLESTNVIQFCSKQSSITKKRMGDYIVSFKNDAFIGKKSYLVQKTELLGNHSGLSIQEFFVPLLYFSIDKDFYRKFLLNKIN